MKHRNVESILVLPDWCQVDLWPYLEMASTHTGEVIGIELVFDTGQENVFPSQYHSHLAV